MTLSVKNIECSSSDQQDFSVSDSINCNMCSSTFQEVNQLNEHMVEHKRKRNTRTFSYDLNEKKARVKLLKGAKRAKNLDVEIKSTCVNMRFSADINIAESYAAS